MLVAVPAAAAAVEAAAVAGRAEVEAERAEVVTVAFAVGAVAGGVAKAVAVTSAGPEKKQALVVAIVICLTFFLAGECLQLSLIFLTGFLLYIL